jgi:hypothetical protein
MGCCYPVGASGLRSSPTRRKPSQHVGSELHVQTQQWEYEAGRNKDAGCVIEPRNLYHGGHEDISHDAERGKPTVSWYRKATVPDTHWRVDGTPPGSESGACIYRGNSGTWESHLSPCAISGPGDRATKGPGVIRGLRPDREPIGDTTNLQKHARYWEASDKRSDPRWAVWQS